MRRSRSNENVRHRGALRRVRHLRNHRVAQLRQRFDLAIGIADRTSGLVTGVLDLVSLVRPYLLTARDHRAPGLAEMLAGFEVKAPRAIPKSGVAHVAPGLFGRFRHRMRPKMPEHLHAVLAIQLAAHMVGK
ncbi:MAG: hypothetical protein K2X34_07165, partial [Hyphomonadaceae bacterium]|nr:hypothetical protein [Hyphomonadaceae bacterium]